MKDLLMIKQETYKTDILQDIEVKINYSYTISKTVFVSFLYTLEKVRFYLNYLLEYQEMLLKAIVNLILAYKAFFKDINIDEISFMYNNEIIYTTKGGSN